MTVCKVPSPVPHQRRLAGCRGPTGWGGSRTGAGHSCHGLGGACEGARGWCCPGPLHPGSGDRGADAVETRAFAETRRRRLPGVAPGGCRATGPRAVPVARGLLWGPAPRVPKRHPRRLEEERRLRRAGGWGHAWCGTGPTAPQLLVGALSLSTQPARRGCHRVPCPVWRAGSGCERASKGGSEHRLWGRGLEQEAGGGNTILGPSGH